MGQVTSRVSDELEAALDRWAAKEGRPRAQLIRDVLAEAADAHSQGRAMFAKPEAIDLKDLQHLVADIRAQQIELGRLLAQNSKRDAALARSAREDTLGVSDARTAIVSRLVAELQQVREAICAMIARLPAEQAEALAASPAFADLTAAVDAQTQTSQDHAAAAKRWFEQPRTHTTYTIWDKNWSSRRVAAALFVFWGASIISYFALAMALPSSWLAVRSANHLLGGGDQAICALVNYRLATDGCRTEIGGKAMRVKVKANPSPKIER